MFETRAEAVAHDFASFPSFVEVANFSGTVDKGRIQYKPVGAPPSDPAHPAYLKLTSSALAATQWCVLNERAPTLDMFGAAGDDGDDTDAFLFAVDHLHESGLSHLQLGHGIFSTSQTIDLPSNFGIEGYGSRRQSGSELAPSHLRWRGGEAPMFTTSGSQLSFRGFGVDNYGSATNWLGLNSGAISNLYEDLYFFVPDGATKFSDAVIKSNGNRMGYSDFKRIRFNSAASFFVYVDGQGTSNSITSLDFDNCLFYAGPGGVANVLYTYGEKIEVVTFRNTTVIAQGAYCRLVDTTGNPLPVAIDTLLIETCEFDCTGSFSGWRYGRLQNVKNAAFRSNKITGGGAMTAAFDLYGSNVTACDSNHYDSIQYMFAKDSGSTVSAGTNIRDTSNTNGLVA
jgi:hypothetical protein